MFCIYVGIMYYVRSLINQACRSLIGLRSGLLVSDKACWTAMNHFGLRPGMMVSDNNSIFVNSKNYHYFL